MPKTLGTISLDDVLTQSSLCSLYNPDQSIVIGHCDTLTRSRRNVILRNCLIDAAILLFVVEQVFRPMGKVLLMQNADTQCTVEGREEDKGQRTFFLTFNLFLSWDFCGSPVVDS